MGGKKFDTGKVPLDLLPPDALIEVARVLQSGAEKYGRYNWSKGIAYDRIYAAALRHLFSWHMGEDTDPETNVSHLAHAACNMLFLLHFINTGRTELDNRPRLWEDRTNDNTGTITSTMPSGKRDE